MTRDEAITNIALMLAGLGVPMSIEGEMPVSSRRLEVVRKPWTALHNESGFGWKDADDYEAMLRRVLA